MHTCYFKDLTKYDKRLEPVTGSVFVFNNEKDWETFIANSNPDTLTNRANLTVIVYDSFPMGSSVSIQNKHGVAMLIDESDLGLLTQHKNGYWCFTLNGSGYAHIMHRKDLGGDGRTPVGFHRLILDFPIGMDVDHINRNKLDNRKENLRICTQSQNQKSFPGRGASKFKGVSPNRKGWRAAIATEGYLKNLGTFTTETEAAKAYDAAAKLQGDDFHFLNFPEESANA